MPSSNGKHEVESRGSAAVARVVLVGRTGCEAALRRTPGVTLLRPRAAFDAIGELAEDVLPDDGVRTVVLVAADAVTIDGSASFVNAVRRIDARAAVYGVDSSEPAAFDGVVRAADGAENVLDLLFGRSSTDDDRRPANGNGSFAQPVPGAKTPPRAAPPPSQRSAPAASGNPPATPAPDRIARPTVASPALDVPFPDSVPLPSAPDQSPLGALLSGRDPVDAAMSAIRANLAAHAEYIPSAGADPANTRGVPVVYGQRLFGRLIADGVPERELHSHAAWLAGWVMLALQEEQLRRAAFTDDLTGAWNRRYFQRFLSAALDQAQGDRRTVTLLVFDIDNFKTYNDRYGHGAGDEILTETVRLLNAVVRPTDRVCRIGGDEFAVIFHEPEGPRNPGSPGSGRGPQSVADIARRFQRQICEHRFPKVAEEAPGTLTISAGLASFPWDGATAEALLERADALALQSKRQGKNTVTLGQGAQQDCDRGDA